MAGRRCRDFQAENEAAARIVLESPERYGGERAVLVEWARLVLRPKVGLVGRGTRNQGELFRADELRPGRN